ncbi:MAG: hypothetical protein ACK4PH_05840 [Aquincola tertiaricarbonis]
MTHDEDLRWMAFHRRVRDLALTALQALAAVALALAGLWWWM